MIIELNAETERLVQEELQSGHFHSVDELIAEAVQAWRELHGPEQISRQRKPKKTLPESPMEPRTSGFDLNLGREQESGVFERKTPSEAVAHIRQSREGNRLPAGVTIKDLINEGRA